MFSLTNDKESPKESRERLRQEELKRNSIGGIHGGGLQDLVDNLGWKLQEYSFFYSYSLVQ